jgi:hypothetical protein
MKILLAYVLLLMAGCMKPDPTGPEQTDAKSGIEDQNLLAGATSSTNWPQEDAGSKKIIAKGEVDTGIVIRFTDTAKTPMKMTGSLSIYQAGLISAIDIPESTTISFSDLDHISIPSKAITGLVSAHQDTILFSILIKSDTLQCLLAGFVYSIEHKKFLKSPFSGITTYSYPFSVSRYMIRGIPDSSLPTVTFSASGKTGWCFYIPGSPFFFNVKLDSAIRIGPVPQGNYPIRLLKLSSLDGVPGSSQLDVFEVKLVFSGKNRDFPYAVSVGDRIFSQTVKSSVSIRSD